MTRILSTLALLAIGCGGAPGLSPTFPDNRAGDLAEVLAQLSASDAPSAPVAVGLGDGQLYAYDLEAGRRSWTQPVDAPGTAPSIAGELVVLQEGDRVVARRLADGAVAFALPVGNLAFVGAAGEGDLAAIVLSTGGAVGARSRVFLSKGGAAREALAMDAAFGVPAVRGGLVFLPWASQNLSVLDGASGREIARLRYQGGVVSQVRATDAGVVFGQRGVGRLAPEASPEAVGWYQPDVSALPGRPPLWRDAYAPPAGPESAVSSVSLAWAPAAGEGPLRMTDDTVYLTFYRLVFGLAQDGLTPRFVYAHPSDVVGARATEGGVMIADAEGGLTFVGADGRPRFSADTGMSPSVVALRLDGFSPSGAPAPSPPLAEQLLAAAEHGDARLVPARAFAVRALAALPEPAVTAHLIALCDRRALPADLRRAACEALGARDSGVDAVLAALARHASYLDDAGAPPVGALATVAARLGERRAVPLLLAHLGDPETPLSAFPALTAALVALGDADVATALRDFLWLYHAEGDAPALAAALGHVARAILTLGGDDPRREVQRVIDAPFTSARVRGQLGEALREAEEREAAEREAEEAAEREAEEAAEQRDAEATEAAAP